MVWHMYFVPRLESQSLAERWYNHTWVKGSWKEDFIEGDEFRDILESAGNEMRNEDFVCKLPGILLAPSNQERQPGVIFILERASLVLAFVARVNICVIG